MKAGCDLSGPATPSSDSVAKYLTLQGGVRPATADHENATEVERTPMQAWSVAGRLEISS